MDDVLKTIGMRLRAHRKGRGLTQDEVAELAGMTQSYIGSVERGEQNLTVVSLDKILHAINMKYDELFKSMDVNEANTSQYILNEITAKLRYRSLSEQRFVLQFVDNLITWKDEKDDSN
ncbi:helix-turn-helix domain-containing protein [Alicyclobacillus fastidiosus]|uniref:Helix-turn-helix domain-containing protein n=1 Tax=Alicyclobacillus fastidiosus TaxID=392011 RepID=A0ABY6ZKC2_9BACL|nr:helix-turn-helix transcriptional regulator [Alicyclobacillus fastidiosus]WAH43255.1 helix-turn-helix domain-containing protein [Alicyclobacillus fastidiosus]